MHTPENFLKLCKRKLQWGNLHIFRWILKPSWDTIGNSACQKKFCLYGTWSFCTFCTSTGLFHSHMNPAVFLWFIALKSIWIRWLLFIPGSITLNIQLSARRNCVDFRPDSGIHYIAPADLFIIQKESVYCGITHEIGNNFSL